MEIRKQKKRMVIIILTVLVAVFAVGGIITAIQLGQMNKLNATACNTSYGQNRLDELKSQGISVTRTIYSDDEIKTDPAKALVKLYCFPNPQKQKSRFISACGSVE